MKRQLILLGLAAAVCITGAHVAEAQSQVDARIAIHAMAAATKNPCDSNSPSGQGLTCVDYSIDATIPGGTSSNAYLIVAQADPGEGVAGMSCGLEYDTSLFLGWTLCADLQFVNDGGNGDWPANLGGNRITWTSTTNCQNTDIGGSGVNAVAGYFYIYSYGGPGSICITPNNNVATPELQVSDCSAAVTDLSLQAAGKLGINGGDSYNPCLAVPTAETSWGDLKTRFE